MTSFSSETSGFLAEARAGLLDPAMRVDVGVLMQLWRYDEAAVHFKRPASLEEAPDLPMRVRGAWGRQLLERTLGRPRRDPWGRSSAWETLFALDPPRNAEHEIGRPQTIHIDASREMMTARIRLFGWAGLYVDDALAALWRALEGGVSLRAGGRMRAAFQPIGAARTRFEGVAGPVGLRHGRIIFESPAVVRRGRRLALDPTSILMSSVKRAASLAPWLELGLAHDAAELREACEALSFDMSALLPARWTRWSQRQPDAPIPVNAVTGSMSFHGDLDPIAPYLRLAETCGLGSHAALGFGRVRVVLY